MALAHCMGTAEVLFLAPEFFFSFAITAEWPLNPGTGNLTSECAWDTLLPKANASVGNSFFSLKRISGFLNSLKKKKKVPNNESSCVFKEDCYLWSMSSTDFAAVIPDLKQFLHWSVCFSPFIYVFIYFFSKRSQKQPSKQNPNRFPAKAGLTDKNGNKARSCKTPACSCCSLRGLSSCWLKAFLCWVTF